MTTIDDRILWIDLETSGSEEQAPGAAILEFGALLTTGAPDFKVLGSLDKVFGMNPEQYQQIRTWDPIVQKMHMDNGLLLKVFDAEARPLDYVQRINLASNLLGMINSVDPPMSPGDRILWGGSGVAHFDRRWIKQFLPEIDGMLTHYALDVGVVRRIFESASPKPPPKVVGEKPHRALADAGLAAIQWKYYWEWIHVRGEDL